MSKDLLGHPPGTNDLFSYLLMAYPLPADKKDEYGDDYLSFLEGQAASLVAGGTETSSTLMASLIYNLLMPPDKLAHLQEEDRQMFTKSEDINVDSVKQDFYLQAVIEEGLRIFPPVAFGLPRVIMPGDHHCGRLCAPRG